MGNALHFFVDLHVSLGFVGASPGNPVFEPTNQPTNMKTTVILYRRGNVWELASYSGGAIRNAPTFPSATAARVYATKYGWSVKRAANCDQ
jgi:hypothetical protein